MASWRSSLEIFLGTKAAVGFSLEQQALGVLGIEFRGARTDGRGRSPALSGQAAEAGAFIPVQAQPVKVFHGELGVQSGIRSALGRCLQCAG